MKHQKSAKLAFERGTQGTINKWIENAGRLEQKRYYHSQCVRGLEYDDPNDQYDHKRGEPTKSKGKYQDEQHFGQFDFLDTDTIQGTRHSSVMFTDRFLHVVVREANQ